MLVVFIAASIIGYWMYRLFARYAAELVPNLPKIKAPALVCAGVASATVIAFGVWLLAYAIGSGTSARLLLGFLLGLVVAYGVEYGAFSLKTGAPSRAPAREGFRPRRPSKKQEKDPPPTADKVLILSLASAVALLALVAPYIDDWLSRVAGLKTAWIEIQFNAISTRSKAIVRPDQRENLFDYQALESLSTYDEAIEREIAFIGAFRLGDIAYRKQEIIRTRENGSKVDLPSEWQSLEDNEKKLNTQRDQLKKLYELLHLVVSPAAKCVVNAIENGLNVDSARLMLGGIIDSLTQLILIEEKMSEQQHGPTSDEANRMTDSNQTVDERPIRKDISTKMKETLGKVSGFLQSRERMTCEVIDTEQIATMALQNGSFESLPHLDIARVLLLLFVKHDALALNVLEDASRKAFKEYNTPFLFGSLMYYRGESIAHYIESLNSMRLIARDRQHVIKQVSDRCGSHCDTDVQKWAEPLRDRAKWAELNAINLIAYAIADDLARDLSAAEVLLPIAEEYGEILLESANKPENSLIESSRDTFLDTAAFVTIVAEAQKAKSSPLNKDKIQKAEAILKTLVTRAELREFVRWQQEMRGPRKNDVHDEKKKFNALLLTFRAHLTAAHGLLE